MIELKVDDAVLIGRVEQRIKESGGVARADDTPETLKNRLAVYYKNTAPLIEYYKKQGKLVTVDGMAPDRRGDQGHRRGHGQGWPEGVYGAGIGLAKSPGIWPVDWGSRINIIRALAADFPGNSGFSTPCSPCGARVLLRIVRNRLMQSNSRP